MIVIDNRYDLLDLAEKYNLPSVYDLLNNLKSTDDAIACTDGESIYIKPDDFNARTTMDQFFILCHEMLHIIYNHPAMSKDPKYSNQKILNICQDICINEFLAKKLKYKTPDGLYLDDFGDILRSIGVFFYSRMYDGSISPYLTYNGVLSTSALYSYVMRYLGDKENELLEKLEQKGIILSGDILEETGNDTQLTQTLKELSSSLKITTKQLAADKGIEAEDLDETSAGLASDEREDFSGTIDTKIYSKQDLIKYIQEFIGNEAVVKGRSRTYSRPNRRMQNYNLVLKGYKQTKNVKEITIYLDTSGSMDQSLVSNLFNMLKSLYQTTKFNLFEFKYNVYPVDLANATYLSKGGGTTIDNVLSHIKKNNYDAAIVITDCEDKFSLKKVDSSVLFFTNNKGFKSNNPLVRVKYFD